MYKLNEDGVAEEMADEEDSTPACSQWILPCKEFHGLWESLIYEDFIQHQILDYAETTMLFSDKGVNSQLINWNRVILMTGPPGLFAHFVFSLLKHFRNRNWKNISL